MDKPDSQQIRHWRRKKGWNQAQLAERAGISEKTLKRLETAKTDAPHPSTLAAIAGALDVPIEALFSPRPAGRAAFQTFVSTDPALGPPEQARIHALPFVGRDREIEQLCQAQCEAARGSGRVVLVRGEPGAGKTRLLGELIALTPSFAVPGTRTGLEIRAGRCAETPGARPFWPFTLILRSYLARPRTPLAGVQEADEPLARLGPLLPELHRPERPSVEAWSDQERFQLFDAMLWFLRAEAMRAPQVLVIDDLQCADPASLLLFEFLAQQISDAAIALIGTYRPTSLAPEHLLLRVVGGLVGSPHVSQIDLGQLDIRSIEALLRADAALAGVPDLPRLLLQKTGGNPLYLEQVLRELHLRPAEGRSPADRVRSILPSSVQEAVGRRLDSLSQEARLALEVAAVEGRRFQPWLVARVAGIGPEACDEVLDQATRAGLVGPASCGRRYEFRHLLLRDAIYARIEVRRRAALHRQVAEVIESRVDCEIDGELSALAHHYLRAGSEGDVDKAVYFASAAAAADVRALAFEDGVSLYHQALGVLETSARAAPEQVVDLLLAMGAAQDRAGDGESSIASFERAARIARRIGSPERIGRAALGVGLRFGQVFDVGLYDPEQVVLIEDALALLDGSWPSLRAQLLARLGTALFWSDPSRSISCSAQAVDVARACAPEDLDALFDALSVRYLASICRGGSSEGQSIAVELAEIAGRTRRAEHRLRGQVIRATDQFRSAPDESRVAPEIESTWRLARSLRQPAAQWWALGFESMQHFMQGRAEEGLALSEQAYRLGARAGTGMIEATWAAHRFSHGLLLGRWEELEAALRAAVGYFPQNPAFRCAQIWIWLKLGEREAARRAFESCIDREPSALQAPLVSSICAALLAEVCFELGDSQRAWVLRRVLRPLGDQNVIAGLGAVFQGPVNRYLGLLAAARGHGRKAQELLRSGRERALRLGAGPWTLRIELDLCTLEARARPGPQTRAAIEKIRESALRAGWLGVARESERLLS